MPRLSVKKWEEEHKKHIAKVLTEIDVLYADATDELVARGLTYAYDPVTGKRFDFSSNKNQYNQVKTTLSSFHDRLLSIISAGVATEWAFANEKTDSWVYKLFSNPKEAYLRHNLNALEAFQKRKIYGHSLSYRVWEYTKQFEQQMELSLSVGIAEGKSATALSKDIRSYLKNPDKLFRRVRNEFDELELSKSARAYHPGMGVYRSSYQNAMRLARTEINMAYREADSTRWKQLDFIVGIEVRLSNSHAGWINREWIPKFKKGAVPEEICDTMAGKYPKDFKFAGWHPNCRCYAVPILANEGTDKDCWEKPENEVTDTPDKFKKWLTANEDNIAKSNLRGTLPYWLSENKKYTNATPSEMNVFSKREKVVKEARKKYNSYSNKWEKLYFDERTGGFCVAHEKHNFSKLNGGGDAEKTVGKILAKIGKQVEFCNENTGSKVSDVKFDNKLWEIKKINAANVGTIRKYIHGMSKKNADNGIFFWDKNNKLPDLIEAIKREKSAIEIYYIKDGVLKYIPKK